MSKKITIQNINNFINGKTKQGLSNLGLLAPHIQEQVSFRLLICESDCRIQGKCIKCGCSLPGRAFTTNTCNSERFPDLMNEEDWIKYKQEKNIE